jgi:hypothetical protein
MAPSIGFDIFAKDRASAVFDKLGKKTDETAKKTDEWSKRSKVAGAAAAAGLVLFAKSAISNASDVSESASKVGVVFGKQSQQILDASKTSAAAMGLSKGAYLDATGTLGNLLVSLKIAPKAAADMSQQMVKLAGDMASFNNVSPEEALAAIKSGLVGETEPLRAFGVNMNDATLRAQALKMGLIKTTKDALDPQVKALAAQALIMDQTKTAQGDFARTSGGLANQQRILKAKLADVSTEMGTKLLPVAVGVATFLTDTAIPAFDHHKTSVLAVGGAVLGLVIAVKAVQAAQVVWNAGTVVSAATQKVLAKFTTDSTVALGEQAVASRAATLGIGSITSVAAIALVTIWQLKKALEQGPKDWFQSKIDPIKNFAKHSEDAGTGQKDLVKSAKDLVAELNGGLAPAVANSGSKLSDEAIAAHEATIKMIQTNDAAGLLRQGLDAFSGKAISAEEATIKFKDGIDQLAHKFDEARKNGDTFSTSLDINTAAGRANRTAVLDSIKAAGDHATALGAQTGSSVKAAAAMKHDEDQIRLAAKAAGFNVTQIDAMIAKYGAVPPVVKTSAELLDHATIPLSAIDRHLSALDGKTVTATVSLDINAKGVPLSAVDRYLGIGHNAAGTNNWRGGLTSINERGGEIINLPSGAQIIPHDVSMAAAQASGGGMDERTLTRALRSALEGASLRIYGDDGSSRRADLMTRAG